MATINDMYKETSSKLKGVIQLRELVANTHDISLDDKTFEFLDKFEGEASSEVKKVEERINKIEDTYKQLAAYLVENPKDFTIEVFFEHFNKLCASIVVNFIY